MMALSCVQARPPMKPRVGVYLSEQMAARLAEAAKRPGATKSGLVEAALDRFLGSDDDVGDTATVARRLSGLSHQLEQLDRNLRIANETVALHARFHLAVTPLLPAAAQRSACALGAERFEEFAAQVGRRVDLGVPLIRETIDRVGAVRADAFARDRAALFTDAGTCRGIEEGEGAVLAGRSAPTWLTAARQVAKDQVENRSLILRVFLPFVFGYYDESRTLPNNG